MRTIITASGAHYEIAGNRIRRRAGTSGNDKRADGEWVALLTDLPDESLVGMRLVLCMESLSHLGPDDQGVEGGGLTTRTTTPVVLDEWIPA